MLVCVRASVSHSSLQRSLSLFCPSHADIFLSMLYSTPPDHSAAIFSQTHTRLCHPHLCFHLVWFLGSSFICIAFVLCHHAVLPHAKACFSVFSAAFGLVSHVQPMALHMLSAILSNKRGSFSFFQVVFQRLVHLSIETEQTPHIFCLPAF